MMELTSHKPFGGAPSDMDSFIIIETKKGLK
jgi:hypothetical protein